MRIAWALMALLAWLGGPVAAAECGPDKLGTSRIASVGTAGGLEVGLKTYPRTIPLADHEVILTFDDGPSATTPAILKALADQCVRATFFDIGRNADSLPEIARPRKSPIPGLIPRHCETTLKKPATGGLSIVYLADGPRGDMRHHEAYKCANRYRQVASGPPQTGLGFLAHLS